MKYVLFLFLIAYSLCSSRRQRPGQIADIYKGIKSKIYKCVSDSEKASAALKELATKNLNSGESQTLNFHSIELTKEDREVIRNCKKEAFKNRISRGKKGSVIPIGIENAVHKKKIVEKPEPVRKLYELNQMGKLGAINIGGIFSCLENAQPAIKVIRDTINLIKSMDYTGALINLYDNFSAVSEGLGYCFNSIFPLD